MRSNPRMRRAVTFALAFCLAAPALAAGDEEQDKKARSSKSRVRAEIIERVVAVVNDEIVLESELVQRAAPSMAQLDGIGDDRERQRRLRALYRQTLNEMVEDELILQAAKEAKLEVKEEEVDRAVEEVQRQNKLTDEQFKEALAAQGYSLDQYRNDVRKQILRLRAINVMVRPRVQVTDDEVKAEYEKMAGKSNSVTEIRVRHILVKVSDDPSADELTDARRRAGELVTRARQGEDFAELARDNSMDFATKEKGGDLGWFKRGELPTEWEEILFAMNEGDVRGPVRGPRGLHVFQVVEQKKDAVRGFDEVKDQIRNRIHNEQMVKQTRVWLEELRKKAYVEIKL